MKTLFATLFAATLAPTWAVAEPIPVRSGEHAAFSRIVAPISGTGWSVTQSGRQVTLSFDGFARGFDLSTLFDLIPRDRIASATATLSELELNLSCDCVVSAVTERGLYVVIDVANTALALESPDSLVAQQTPETVAEQDADRNTLTPLTDPTRRGAIIRSPLPQTFAVLPSEGTDVVQALQDRLAAELQTATNRGVLSPTLNPLSTPSAAARDTSTDRIQAPSSAEPTTDLVPFLPDPDLANLRISTSRDLPKTFRDLSEITSIQGQVCPPDQMLAVASWGDGRPFADQLAEARQGLFGELDRVDTDVAIKLAKTYLYFGFGAEAIETLKLLPKGDEKAAYLRTLASIMDGGDALDQNPLSGLTECEGETALWAALVAPMPPEGALPPADTALRTLNALPSHLRLLLAPKLHRVLLAYGNPDGASATLRSLERLPGDLPPAAKVAEAQGNLEKGKTEKGTQQLAEVAQGNAAQSPKALIALVDAKLKAKQPISAETAQLVEAYAQELRQSELGPDLRRVQILSLAQSGQFDAAYEKLDAQDATDNTPLSAGLKQQVLRNLTANANDIVFLDHALDQDMQALADLPQKDALNLVQRLIDLGFPVEAERIMATLPTLPRQKDRQLVSAKVSLAMRKPFRAQAELLNVDGPDADRLRADAKRMAGDHEEAHALYEELDITQDATETAWLASDWRSLIEQQTPTFGPAAALSTSEVDAETGMLARTSSLLGQSSATRETLQNLLSAEDLQVPPPEN